MGFEIPDTDSREVALIAVASKVAWHIVVQTAIDDKQEEAFKRIFASVYESMNSTVKGKKSTVSG